MDTETTSRVERAAGAPVPPRPHAHEEEGTKPAENAGKVNRWVLLGIVLALVGGGVLFARKRQASNAAAAAAAVPKERVVPVTVATGVKKDVPIWREGLGHAT